MSKLVPCMWFNGDAEEAAKFYVSLVPDSKITHVQRNVTDNPSGKEGSVLVVGPSGIFSVASYHRVFCSAQKYGPVKISCMQTICTPCFAAWSRNVICFSMFASRIFFSGASVGPAWVA